MQISEVPTGNFRGRNAAPEPGINMLSKSKGRRPPPALQSTRAEAVGLSGRSGRVTRGSAVLRHKAGGGKLKERIWGEIIPILATECIEDTEKCKTLCALSILCGFKYHINYILLQLWPPPAAISNNLGCRTHISPNPCSIHVQKESRLELFQFHY